MLFSTVLSEKVPKLRANKKEDSENNLTIVSDKINMGLLPASFNSNLNS